MGVSPIEYSPWKGKRTGRYQRILVIIKKIIGQKIRSKGVLALLIIGMILTHVFPAIFLSLSPHEELTGEMLVRQGLFGNYLTGGFFATFTILLAAVVSSDTISEDLNDNSFILYFSRPIRPIDYLLGKLGGTFLVMSIFCLLGPVIVSLSIIATQTGSDFISSFKVLGRLLVAGILASELYLSYGVMISSFTEKKAYAGVSTFMSFVVLSIVGGIFSSFNPNWRLISPINILHYSFDLIFGFDLPSDINSSVFWAVLLSMVTMPLLVLYFRIYTKEVGKRLLPF